MAGTLLHIKNMVCKRCIRVIEEEFGKLQLDIESIELGEVRITKPLSEQALNEIREVLLDNGFELIDDKKSQLIEQIKNAVIELVHYTDDATPPMNSSEYIAQKLSHDYSYLSKLFSGVEGITIEKYIIAQKIERAKELLVYNELSLKEIAFQLGYSSVQHLSNQFKKVSGLSPSHFKKLKHARRKPLDEV